MLSAVTVVVHGADFPGPSGGPLTDMGEELYGYWNGQGTAARYAYQPNTGTPQRIEGVTTAEHKIVVFDWSFESWFPSVPGYDEAAGDALFAMLVDNNLQNSDYLHLIGHSRGAIVASEAAQRLLFYGFEVDQLTLLDHERGPGLFGAAGDPHAWADIGFVDNYYGDGTWWQGRILQGEDVDGADNLHLPKDHGGIADWYVETIKAPDSHSKGFKSRLINSPGTQTPRTPLVQPPSVMNGKFDYGPDSSPTGFLDDDFAGWAHHGGSGDGDNRVTASNNYLELEFSEATRTHNRLYVPASSTHLEFDVHVAEQSTNDTLEVYVGGSNVQTVTLTPSPSDPAVIGSRFDTFSRVTADISAFQGSVQTLTFEIDAPGALNVVDSRVQIDNVAFISQTFDDHGNNAASASPIGLNRFKGGDIEVNDDADWFRFNATSGFQYVIDTTLNGLSDTELTLYDQNGFSVLDSDDDSGTGLASKITWTAAATGAYYVKVTGNGVNSGRYQVRVSETVPVIRLGFVSRRFPDYVPQTTSSISISLPERN